MNKRKPYYIIIAALCFASIISFFLPYLHLPAQEGVSKGYKIDSTIAALESNIIRDVAKESGIARNIVYNAAKNIVKGKDRQAIESRLKENEYYVIDILSERMNAKIAELEELGDVDGNSFSYFEMIKLSTLVIKHYEQDVISAFLVIFTLIITVVLSFISGFIMLLKRNISSYKPVKILSLINIFMSFVGVLSINAIGIGALQINGFYKSNWGMGFFFIAAINALVLLIAIIGNIHERWAGIITFRMILKQKQLILMTIPFILYTILFSFGPLVGWVMAFQNYKPAAGSNQVWIAWEKFTYLLTDKDFLMSFRNTVAMSMINLVLTFVFAIGFALLLNEVKNVKGKKLVQTVSYLPHFLSWIIVAAIVRNALSVDGGILNDLLVDRKSVV